jgi:hypothetical protein
MPRHSNPAAILAIILISYFMILVDNSVIFSGWREVADAALAWLRKQGL